MRNFIIGAAVALGLVAQHAAAAQSGVIGPATPAKAGVKVLLLAGNIGKGKSNVLGTGHGNSGVFVPPGQAKKWARGQYLPKTVVWTLAPAAILAKLKPAPPGHQYVVVDGQVLLIAVATGLILDALGVF